MTKPSNCGQNSVKIKTVNSVNNNVSCYSTENSNSNIDMDQIRQKMADVVALPNKTPRVSLYLYFSLSAKFEIRFVYNIWVWNRFEIRFVNIILSNSRVAVVYKISMLQKCKLYNDT